MRRNLSYYCLLGPRIYIFVLRAHAVRGESHNQRNPPERLQHSYQRILNPCRTIKLAIPPSATKNDEGKGKCLLKRLAANHMMFA